MKQAVFLDRDGVIIEENGIFNYKPTDMKLIPKSAEAIKILNESDYKVIIISNQSGVARDIFTEHELSLFSKLMKDELKKYGAMIDAEYYCIHHPNALCNCRKPKNGMIKTAEKDLNINLKKSFIVGDRWSDIEAGIISKCQTILVKTGYGQKALNSKNLICNYVATNLFEAVEYIIKTNGHEGI